VATFYLDGIGGGGDGACPREAPACPVGGAQLEGEDGGEGAGGGGALERLDDGEGERSEAAPYAGNRAHHHLHGLLYRVAMQTPTWSMSGGRRRTERRRRRRARSGCLGSLGLDFSFCVCRLGTLFSGLRLKVAKANVPDQAGSGLNGVHAAAPMAR
jgi:hypothetical protein